MVSPCANSSRYPRRFGPAGILRLLFPVLIVTALAACSNSHYNSQQRVAALHPLHLEDQTLTLVHVPERVVTPDLLALDDPMRDFVAQYTGGVPSQRARLMTLHRALRGAATLGVDYDPAAEGTARDAFHSQTANCLSYAALFVAMAREAGLDADFQWLQVRPQWTRSGERVMVRRHINARIRLRNGEQFMVDIDPLEARDITGSFPLRDTDAQALYHSNIAMTALTGDDLATAWLHSVRALQLSPDMAQLWVNLGVVYRAGGQNRQAERHYQYALALDVGEYSAMNNLVVLYGLEERFAERDYWSRQVMNYRQSNPYYHAWQGDEAALAGNLPQAIGHYERAIALSFGDSRLLAALGVSYAGMGEEALAVDYLQRAVAAATTREDTAYYQMQLDRLQREPAPALAVDQISAPVKRGVPGRFYAGSTRM